MVEVRALLLGLMVLSTGCDLLFQIDHLNAPDARLGEDTEGPKGMITITARATANGGLTSVLTLDFGAVPPKPSDMTIIAICYNNDQLPSGAQAMDQHAHPLSQLLTTQTPVLYSELWYGRADGNVVITFDHMVNGPDARAIAYSGIDQTLKPLAVAGTVTGSQAVSAGPIPLDATLQVLVAATCVAGQTTAIQGFQQQLEINGNWLADLQLPGPDSLIVTASQLDVAQGILQVAALAAAE